MKKIVAHIMLCMEDTPKTIKLHFVSCLCVGARSFSFPHWHRTEPATIEVTIPYTSSRHSLNHWLD